VARGVVVDYLNHTGTVTKPVSLADPRVTHPGQGHDSCESATGRDRVAGLHSFTPYVREPAEPGSYGALTAQEEHWLAARGEFFRSGRGYSLEQSTRPQTVGYVLTDSPVAQLAWLLDKFWAWTDHDGDPRSAISQDRMLDLVTFYWLSVTAGSSARFYWENFPPDNSGTVTVPSAVTIFPADIEKVPRPWVESRFTDLRSFRVAARGGHFPMLEVAGSYVDELRYGLGPMPLVMTGQADEERAAALFRTPVRMEVAPPAGSDSP